MTHRPAFLPVSSLTCVNLQVMHPDLAGFQLDLHTYIHDQRLYVIYDENLQYVHMYNNYYSNARLNSGLYYGIYKNGPSVSGVHTTITLVLQSCILLITCGAEENVMCFTVLNNLLWPEPLGFSCSHHWYHPVCMCVKMRVLA